MQKTRLTVLIEEIDKTIDYLKGMDTEYDKGQKDVYVVIRDIAIEMLPKEREDIEKAFMNGAGTVFGCTSYFDTNYSQYKP